MAEVERFSVRLTEAHAGARVVLVASPDGAMVRYSDYEKARRERAEEERERLRDAVQEIRDAKAILDEATMTTPSAIAAEAAIDRFLAALTPLRSDLAALLAALDTPVSSEEPFDHWISLLREASRIGHSLEDQQHTSCALGHLDRYLEDFSVSSEPEEGSK